MIEAYLMTTTFQMKSRKLQECWSAILLYLWEGCCEHYVLLRGTLETLGSVKGASGEVAVSAEFGTVCHARDI